MKPREPISLAEARPTGAAVGRVASIVIPTRVQSNAVATLLDELAMQIDALEDADRHSVEVIIVDNSPTAEARRLCERMAGAFPCLCHIHVPSPGVVQVRNAGVAAARGRYVIFLDDDEIPAKDWLRSWLAQAATGVEAAFGPVEPLYEIKPAATRGILDRMFTRRFDLPTGSDVTRHLVRLGTGNSMLLRSRLDGEGTFDARFNQTGGEDLHLIGQLTTRGVRLIWNREAAVEEVVEAERMTVAYLKRRRFNQAQLRCVLALRAGGSLAWFRVAFWMFVGLTQVTANGIGYLLARATGKSDHDVYAINLQGGLGKLLWGFRISGTSLYAEAESRS